MKTAVGRENSFSVPDSIIYLFIYIIYLFIFAKKQNRVEKTDEKQNRDI